MDPKRIVTLVVGASVMVLIFSAILVPIIGTGTNTTATADNAGPRYALYEAGEAHAITFTADSMITDGVAQPLPDTSVYGSATVIYGTAGIIRYTSEGRLGWYGVISGAGQNRDLGLATNITINVSEEGIGTTEGASSNRSIGTVIAYANPTGQYALTYNPYVLEDSTIFGAGNTVIEGVNYGVYWTGTVTDGITVSSIIPPNQVIGEVTINTSNPATNLLKIDSVVIPDTTAGADLTYTYFFAPAQITYDNPTYVNDSGVRALLSAIPIIAMIGIVLAVVGVAIVGRNDY